jgi:hypothetical protein
MADLAALLVERARIQAQADADLRRVGRDIVAALCEVLPAPWEVHIGWARRDRRPGRGQRYVVEVALIAGGLPWHAHATYRPSDNSPAGGPDRVTDGAIGATPRDALAQLGADIEKMIPRMRRPEVVADLRHLRQWLADVVAEMDGVEVDDG